MTEVTMDQVCEEVALMRKDLKSIEKSLDRLLDALFERAISFRVVLIAFLTSFI